jgi:hypothetical protein
MLKEDLSIDTTFNPHYCSFRQTVPLNVGSRFEFSKLSQLRKIQ